MLGVWAGSFDRKHTKANIHRWVVGESIGVSQKPKNKKQKHTCVPPENHSPETSRT